MSAALAFGVLAAFTGQLVAYPLETVSRRIQVRMPAGRQQLQHIGILLNFKR